MYAFERNAAQEHWEIKHVDCGGFDEKAWRPAQTTRWFFEYDHIARANVRKVEDFQEHYEANRVFVYTPYFRTSAKKVWKIVVLAGLCSFAIAWGVVNGVYFNIIDLDTCFRNMEACVVLLDVALPFASVSLALYIWFRLWRFAEILSQCSLVQCAIEEVALLVGYSMSRNLEDDKQVEIKDEAFFLLSKYLNLVHQLIFLKISKRFERYTMGDMVTAQLISKADRNSLSEFRYNDTTGLAVMWIGHLITQLMKHEILEQTFVGEITRSLAEMRRCSSRLMEEGKRLPPLSYLQLVQIAADVTCILSPLVILYKLLLGPNDLHALGGQRLSEADKETASHIDQTANDMMYRYSRGSVYMIPAFGTMLVTLIYQSILQLARDIEDPFNGIGADNLNADRLLQITEMRIATYLTKASQKVGKVKLTNVFEGEVIEVVLTFKPGRAGFEVDGKTGQVLHVYPGTQAWNSGKPMSIIVRQAF
jgi:hypothetical protein